MNSLAFPVTLDLGHVTPAGSYLIMGIWNRSQNTPLENVEWFLRTILQWGFCTSLPRAGAKWNTLQSWSIYTLPKKKHNYPRCISFETECRDISSTSLHVIYNLEQSRVGFSHLSKLPGMLMFITIYQKNSHNIIIFRYYNNIYTYNIIMYLHGYGKVWYSSSNIGAFYTGSAQGSAQKILFGKFFMIQDHRCWLFKKLFSLIFFRKCANLLV